MRTRRLIGDQRIDGRMFQRLVGADEFAELLAGFQILHRVVHAACRRAAGFRREEQRRRQIDMSERFVGARRIEQRIGGDLHAIKLQTEGAARLIGHHFTAQRAFRQGRLLDDDKRRGTVLRHRSDDPFRTGCIDDENLRAGELQFAALFRRLRLDMSEVPVGMGFGQRKGCGLAGAYLRQDGRFLRLRAARQQRLRGKRRRYEGTAHQAAAHLLHHRHDFGHGEADAAKLFGYGNAEPAQRNHFLPDGGVVTQLVLDQLTDGRNGRLVAAEILRDFQKFGLFFAECERDVSFHCRFPAPQLFGRPSTCSPMMLCWIWLVPPPIVPEKALR